MLKLIVIILISFLISILSQKAPSELQVGYKLWCIGNCDNKVDVVTTPGAVLMGGGTDVDEAFNWQIRNANRGDFLILRTSGDDAYNPWVYNLSIQLNYTLNSVTTILFRNAIASNNSIISQAIIDADAIFFAGGDQSIDLAYWVSTPVQSLIQKKIMKITIGGTSAGCAILGGKAVYSGGGESVTSDQALQNPYNLAMVIVPPFLNIPFLESVITDTHFVTRDRMGRTLTFISRINTDSSNPPIRGIGVNESTALLLDYSTGMIQTVGTGSAYICNSADLYHPSIICENGLPLTFHNITCHRLDIGNNYSFVSWDGDGTTYEQSVEKGVVLYPPYN